MNDPIKCRCAAGVIIGFFLHSLVLSVGFAQVPTSNAPKITASQQAEKLTPQLLLAKPAQLASINVTDYLISEKLDGVRAYWDGKQLRSRSGQIFSAPEWFIAPLPRNQALDGELWIARGQFEQVVSVVRRQKQDVDGDQAWQSVSYQLFELPDHSGEFRARYQALQNIVQNLHQQGKNQHIQVIKQHGFSQLSEAESFYQQIVAGGGEGIMLHKKNAHYHTGRQGDLLKIKPHDDAEATVVGYRAGKGKYRGQVGALLVKTPDGRAFAIGSGLSDTLRAKPPAIGSVVTYQYNGLTKKGLPRFPRFLRLRERL